MGAPRLTRRLVVTPLWSDRTKGRVTAGAVTTRCVLGRAGVSLRKREGDGATPVGDFAILGGLARRDRFAAPSGPIALQIARRTDGWCDDPSSGAYNRPVRAPFAKSHERLWRDDSVYDVVLILDYNLRVRRKPLGSAIFFHLTNASCGPTAGCLAIARDDMRRLLPRLARQAVVSIRLPDGRPRPKDRGADADMRRAHLDRQFKIRAHAH